MVFENPASVKEMTNMRYVDAYPRPKEFLDHLNHLDPRNNDFFVSTFIFVNIFVCSGCLMKSWLVSRLVEGSPPSNHHHCHCHCNCHCRCHHLHHCPIIISHPSSFFIITALIILNILIIVLLQSTKVMSVRLAVCRSCCHTLA